jgi:hypothetical protein
MAPLHPRYRWSTRALRLASRLVGRPFPSPVHVPLGDPLPIARWMAGVLRVGDAPHLETFPSSAVRVCQSARAAGIDLTGAHFSVIGEPFTPARQAAIRSVGAEAVSRYGSTECPSAGWGCLEAPVSDDYHLSHDLWVLTQPGRDGATRELPASALLFSSLRRENPLTLLNASVGDQADVGWHACGCPLERVGWTTHLRNVRSFEKLTAGGMTFFDADVIQALEQALPRRFGGGPTDYQLVEQEDADGRPALRLLVHPALGPLDPAAVAEAFLAAIAPGTGTERVMGQVWRDGQLLRVERRPPRATPSGKILHLQVDGSR